MKFQEIAKTIKGSERKEMQEAIKENQEYMRNYSKHKEKPIRLMFVRWDKLFPTNKQDIKCSSCRKAVVKFWNEINKEWLEEKSIPNTKPNTKKKTKKSSTLTGALASGCGTSK